MTPAPLATILADIDALLAHRPVGLLLVRPGVPPSDDLDLRMALVADAVQATMSRMAERSDRDGRATGDGGADDLLTVVEADMILLGRPALTAPAETEGLALRLHTYLGRPLILGDEVVTCTISIGAAVSRVGDTGADLLGYARHALEDARALGGDRVVTFDDLDRELLEPPTP